jgi:hypothetical protein
MTWEHLRDLDCGAVRTLGDTWKTYIDQQLAHTERLRTDVIEGHLGTEHYESDTATQVRDQIGMTADRSPTTPAPASPPPSSKPPTRSRRSRTNSKNSSRSSRSTTSTSKAPTANTTSTSPAASTARSSP